jgi:hypothetical protein
VLEVGEVPVEELGEPNREECVLDGVDIGETLWEMLWSRMLRVILRVGSMVVGLLGSWDSK